MTNEIYFAVKGGKKHILVNKPNTVCLIYKTFKIYDYIRFENKYELTEYLKTHDKVVKLKNDNFDLWFNKLEAGYYNYEMQSEIRKEIRKEMQKDNTHSDRYSMCMCDEVECLCFFDTFIHGRR